MTRSGWHLALAGTVALWSSCTASVQNGGGSGGNVTGSGGIAGPGSGGNGGATTGSGGKGGTTTGSGGNGGATAGSGGKGGTTTGSGGNGGATTGSGGKGGTTTGSGGSASGSGGITGSGGRGSGGSGTGSGGKGGTTTGSGGSASGSGGITGSGGKGSGGSAGATGSCPGSCTAPTPTSCSSPTVRVSQVSIGSTLNYSTDETANIPLAIAAKPGGGSLIAWMTGYSRSGSSTASQVHVAELDCEDKLVGTPFTMEAHDFQDLAADGNGGVIVLTRDGQGTDAQHCGDVNNLCVTPSDRPGCYGMYMVRFDCNGTQQWATKLTSDSASAPTYSSGSGYNYSIWWYQHHGRIAHDGTNYAAYFCDAITVANNSCSAGAGKVDIHQGDRMKVVGPTGTLLSGHDSFDLGCSHSWTTRMVWDPRTNHFVTVCATDNNCRIARSPGYTTIKSASCDGSLFNGDIVLAGDTGYWLAWSYQGVVRLEHFATGTPDKTITTASTVKNPHLVSYGPNRMLLTWKSGTGLAAQIYDSTSGATVGSQFTIAAPDHPWQAWKAFPDGSAAWATTSSASSTIQIARVMPCSS